MAKVAAATAVALIGAGLSVQPAAAAPPAGYVPKSALINGDSIDPSLIDTGGGASTSLEQYAAERAGFAVTVVTGAQWGAMTAADFAKYQVLIIGDPHCSFIPSSATGNASVWAPVVMGKTALNSTVGNRSLVGTDPVFHYAAGGGAAAPTNPDDPSTAGTEHLVQSAISYAGGVDGATGVYFNTSCGDNGDAISVLNSLSSSGSGFTQDTSPPCGGDVALIASNPVFSSVTYTDLQGWGCSVHTTYPTYPTDWQPLGVATDTATKPTCGINTKDGTTACGESYILVAGQGIVVTAPDLALTPSTNTSPAGGSHTVTAAVTQGGSPASGQSVTFTVTGQNAGVTGTCVPASCVSDATGKVTFTYPDANGAGTDTINAAITVGGTTQHATASQTWTAAPVNHPPTADDKSVTTDADTPVNVTLSGADTDGDSLTYAIVTNPAHGTLSGSGANRSYTPDAGYTGSDSFTYKTNDGQADSGTATVSITVKAKPSGCPTAPATDATVTGNIKKPSATFTAPALSTGGDKRLLLAFISADGPNAPTQKVTSVSGGGLTWSLAVRSNKTWGSTEVWQAYAPSKLSGVVVKAKLAYAYDGSITVSAYSGAASKVGQVAAGAGISKNPRATLEGTACGSLVRAVGHDWTNAGRIVPGGGQSLLSSFLDTRVQDSFWVQKVDEPTATAGSTVSVGGSLAKSDRWTLAAVEIPAAPPAG